MFNQVICCFIGVWLIASAWPKFRDVATFTELAGSYPLPRWLKSKSWMIAVPGLESLLAAALLSLDGRLAPAALSGALSFVGGATCLIAARLARGEKRFRCGCGGDFTEEQNADLLMIRNLFLIVILI